MTRLMKEVIEDELDSLAEKAADVADHLRHLQATGGSDVRGNRYSPAETARYIDGAKRQLATYDAMHRACKELILTGRCN